MSAGLHAEPSIPCNSYIEGVFCPTMHCSIAKATLPISDIINAVLWNTELPVLWNTELHVLWNTQCLVFRCYHERQKMKYDWVFQDIKKTKKQKVYLLIEKGEIIILFISHPLLFPAASSAPSIFVKGLDMGKQLKIHYESQQRFFWGRLIVAKV